MLFVKSSNYMNKFLGVMECVVYFIQVCGQYVLTYERDSAATHAS